MGGKYATLYSLGNLIMLSGTFFLAGPVMQCRNMKRYDRGITTGIFVAATVLTLISTKASFRFHTVVPLALILVQWCAIVWYLLSYIPFAREGATKILQGTKAWVGF